MIHWTLPLLQTASLMEAERLFLKSIKVKRKGNESVLMITAEENDTKVEYCYSVAPKDEESLKKAVADIEACYIKKRKG